MIDTQARNAPRVTLNALADYLTAAAGRRRTIVGEQKRPKTFRVAYYAEAEGAIVAALSGDGEAALDLGVARVQALPTGKEWEASRRQTELDALDAFRAFLRGDGPSTLPTLSRAPQRPRPFSIGGVNVSVRPELVAIGQSGLVEGAIKLYFSKGDPLNDERARYAGALLHYYVEQVLGAGASADFRRCVVLDVFAGRLTVAPRTYRRRRQDIDAACTEIGTMWTAA